MRALVFDTKNGSWESTRGFELQNVPEPTMGGEKSPPESFKARARDPIYKGGNKNDAESVIIKLHFAGVCGSDRGIWNRTAFQDQILGSLATEGKTRRIIGHESFGEIVALGSAAGKKYKLKVGDFVSCESHVICQNCLQCKLGEVHVCINERILGISHDGCFAEYMKVPGHIVWKTDTDKIRSEIGAVQEPFGNAVHAASKVPLKDKTIAIFGLGPIGLFLLLVARGLGAKHIIGIEPNPVSREMAKQLGIDYVIPLSSEGGSAFGGNKGGAESARRGLSSLKRSQTSAPRGSLTSTASYSHDESVIKQIEELTGGLGVDIAFEMSGYNSSFNNCLFATRRGGDIIAFGIKSGDFTLEDYNRFIVRGLTVHAVIGRRLPETWETTTKLLSDPKNKIQENIWNIILERGKDTILPLAEYTKERFEEMMAEHPKILIEI